MPVGLFASLAGAAYGPMRKVCPVRRLPLQPALRLRLGRDVSGPRMLLPGLSVQHPPVPAASIAPPLPPPALKRTQRSASRIKFHHSLRLLPASSPYCPSMLCAPFLHPAPALSPFIPPIRFPLPGLSGAAPPSRLSKGKRLCAQPAFFQPSRHLCAKKNHFVKKNANTALLPSSLPDNSACSPPERPLKTGAKNRKNQEITDFFRQSALTSPAKHVSVFSIAAGLQAVLGITCGVSVTFERVFFHVQVHLCWEPPLGRY